MPQLGCPSNAIIELNIVTVDEKEGFRSALLESLMKARVERRLTLDRISSCNDNVFVDVFHALESVNRWPFVASWLMCGRM